MLFGSYEFLVFLAAVLCAIKATERFLLLQRLVVLGASWFFYGYWDATFLLLMIVSSLACFGIGLAIDASARPESRRAWLTFGLVANVAVLGFFKYFSFFQESAEKLLTLLGIGFELRLLEVVLPVGISFYTFQAMAYLVDVYRKEVSACRDPIVFCTFLAYFPQLVAGPIERATALLPQIARPLRITVANLLSGALLVLWGLFKKAVVADTAGQYLADPLFASPESGALIWCGLIAFAIQIYCDFSGYCDIARGTSRMLGVGLAENFHAPYLATSIAEFWRRWHMTLSYWFRDYVYIPLGGSRCARWRVGRNLVVTMLLCGLWHGADWKFVLWGAYHGGLLLAHRWWVGDRRQQEARGAMRVWKTLCCFGVVTYGWLLFRVESSSDVLKLTRLLFLDLHGWLDWGRLASPVMTLAVLGAFTILAHLVQIRAVDHRQELEDLALPTWGLGAACGCAAVLLLAFGTLGQANPFLYFQF